MATDIYLKLDKIDGESADDKHKKELEIESFSWGASNAAAFGHGTGAGVGKVSFQDLNVTKRYDKSSPVVMEYCATLQHIAEATLSCRKAGGEQGDYLTVKMTNVAISSVSLGSGGDGLITESLTLNCEKVELSYFVQDEKGKLSPGPKFKYDFKLNKKL